MAKPPGPGYTEIKVDNSNNPLRKGSGLFYVKNEEVEDLRATLWGVTPYGYESGKAVCRRPRLFDADSERFLETYELDSNTLTRLRAILPNSEFIREKIKEYQKLCIENEVKFSYLDFSEWLDKHRYSEPEQTQEVTEQQNITMTLERHKRLWPARESAENPSPRRREEPRRVTLPAGGNTENSPPRRRKDDQKPDYDSLKERELSQRKRELDLKERELALREAELDEREQELDSDSSPTIPNLFNYHRPDPNSDRLDNLERRLQEERTARKNAEERSERIASEVQAAQKPVLVAKTDYPYSVVEIGGARFERERGGLLGDDRHIFVYREGDVYKVYSKTRESDRGVELGIFPVKETKITRS